MKGGFVVLLFKGLRLEELADILWMSYTALDEYRPSSCNYSAWGSQVVRHFIVFCLCDGH